MEIAWRNFETNCRLFNTTKSPNYKAQINQEIKEANNDIRKFFLRKSLEKGDEWNFILQNIDFKLEFKDLVSIWNVYFDNKKISELVKKSEDKLLKKDEEDLNEIKSMLDKYSDLADLDSENY